MQNRVITAALKGIEQLVKQNKEIIEENRRLIDETKELRASMESFGLSKLCPTDLTSVTEDTGMVLSAKEKNASLSGTLANLVQSLGNKFSSNGEILNAFNDNKFTTELETEYNICSLDLPEGKWILFGTTLASGDQFIKNADALYVGRCYRNDGEREKTNTCIAFSNGNRRVEFRLIAHGVVSTVHSDRNYVRLTAIKIG